MVDQQVSRHTRYPRRKSPVRRAIASQCPIYAQEYLLRNVLGLGSIAYEPVTDIENATRVPTYKFLPGRAIALEATLDQLGILLQAFLAPFSSNLLRHNSLRELLGLSINGT